MEFSRRKWGYYLTLIKRKHFKIKLLWFRNGGHLSMQRHFKRAETWLFIYGSGKTSLDGFKGQAFHGDKWNIPVGSWHQFLAWSNTLVLEIQTGDCREEDIERV